MFPSSKVQKPPGFDVPPNGIVREWTPPLQGVREANGTVREMTLLLETLPKALVDYLEEHYTEHSLMTLNEIYMQLGQFPELIFADQYTGKTKRETLEFPCTQDHIAMFAEFFMSEDDSGSVLHKRKGISSTLHRVSLITHPLTTPERVIGVAIRVGRALEGLLETMVWPCFLDDLAERGESLLLIGKPGVGSK